MKFDDILEHHVGEFSPYQKRIYFLVCLPAVAGAIMSLLPVFMLAHQDFRCALPGMPNDTYAVQSELHQTLINLSIPMETNVLGLEYRSECKIYSRNDSFLAMTSHMFSSNISENVIEPNASTEFCHKYVYDTSKYVTAISEYDMVCGSSILKSHFLMITFIGGLIGSIINGILSDIVGRKKVFLGCLCVYLFSTIIQVFAPVYLLFLAMRLVQGISGAGVFMISFIYVLEIVGPHYRMFAGIFIELFWCFGLFILVGVAYFIRKWKYMMMTLMTPCLLFFTYFWIIPESPRWLLATGKVAEAEVILKRIADSNNTELPEKLLEKTAKEEKENESKREKGQVWKLFTYRVLLVRFLIIVFNRFALNMSYYGISLNIEHLSGDLHLNYTLSSAVETLASICILLLISVLGRKPLYIGSMIIGSLGFLFATLPILFGGEEDFIYAVILVMVGKFGVTAAYAVIYVYGSEIFPTSVRSSAMGLTLVIELTGGMISPYIVDISYLMEGRAGAAFPGFVFGGLGLVAALFAFFLPETRNKQMPETIKDSLHFAARENVLV